MHISARSDYAVRAMLAIAATGADGGPVRATELADTHQIPLSFLRSILQDLRRAGLLHNHRGVDGGYVLARPADDISVGEVLRTVSGELTSVRGLPAELTRYAGSVAGLHEFWLSVHTAVTDLVDHTSLTDLLAGQRRPVA